MIDILRARALAVLVPFAASPAWGHDGHGVGSGSSWLHLLTEPVHALPALLLLVLALTPAVAALRSRRARLDP
jgi:hypothetical protein